MTVSRSHTVSHDSIIVCVHVCVCIWCACACAVYDTVSCSHTVSHDSITVCALVVCMCADNQGVELTGNIHIVILNLNLRMTF